MAWPKLAMADLTHETVSGVAISRVMLDDEPIAWEELQKPRSGEHKITFDAQGSVLVPHCNGRSRVLSDDKVVGEAFGPVIAPPGHITIEVKASAYEKRIACSHAPVVGAALRSADGISLLKFASPNMPKPRAGEAVVFVPGGHDLSKPSAVLVGTHPWNGTPWTYAAYSELIDEAGKKDVVLLLPSGLGNSLYVADAEREVMLAIDALGKELPVDPQRVSIFGASMGGAGSTTISFHHPDRFAFVTSYFGDSRYDMTTYVKTILGESGKTVNALDVLENARWLPVFLVHGDLDKSSPIRQSLMLEDAMKKAGFVVDFAREPKMEHEGPLVVKYIRRVVDRAAEAVAPRRPARVSFRTVRPEDTGAYGVRIVRAEAGTDAFVDVELRSDGVHVLAAENARAIVLAKDAFDVDKQVPLTDPRLRWE